MMPSLYFFSEYSTAWPLAFAVEAELLRTLLGDQLVAVHHIGSTSVPGLAAKPTIDMLPVVRDIARIDAYINEFEVSGYRSWGEYGLPGRRFFTKDRDAYRTHNIHIYQADDPDIERHLAFCAYLRFHEAIRTEYESLKRRIYAEHPADIVAYNDGKNEWIKQIEPLAIEWYRRVNQSSRL